MLRTHSSVLFVALATTGLAQEAPKPQDPKQPTTQAPAQAQAPAPSEIPVPSTTVFPEPKSNKHLDPSLAPKPLPDAKLALIGGTVEQIDPIRNRMIVHVHGSKNKMHLFFDQRSKISRNGEKVLQTAIRKGDRVYLDTQTIDGELYAKQIQVVTNSKPADVNGQVLAFDAARGTLTVRDQLSAEPVTFAVQQTTQITKDGEPSTAAQLQPGTIIAASFLPAAGGRVLSELKILATPGSEFTFFGNLTYLDLRSGVLALENKSDGKVYEVRFAPEQFKDDLRLGTDVAIVARFDGNDYVARSLTVHGNKATAETTEDERNR